MWMTMNLPTLELMMFIHAQADHQNVRALFARGSAYLKKNQLELAVADFSLLVELNGCEKIH
jgi:hypothetical protein